MNDNGNQYETISKFDRTVAGLKGGNNLETKATTVEYVNPITGESETFVIQTIRTEQRKTVMEGLEEKTVVTIGDFIVVKYLDKDGYKRLILPPKVAATIERQHNALIDRARSNQAKAKAKERQLRGELPGFMKKKVQEATQ